MDCINYLPKDLKVSISDKWDDKSKLKEIDGKKIDVLEHISDWTFSTPYKGSLRLLSTFSQKDHLKDSSETTKQ